MNHLKSNLQLFEEYSKNIISDTVGELKNTIYNTKLRLKSDPYLITANDKGDEEYLIYRAGLDAQISRLNKLIDKLDKL